MKNTLDIESYYKRMKYQDVVMESHQVTEVNLGYRYLTQVNLFLSDRYRVKRMGDIHRAIGYIEKKKGK